MPSGRLCAMYCGLCLKACWGSLCSLYCCSVVYASCSALCLLLVRERPRLGECGVLQHDRLQWSSGSLVGVNLACLWKWYLCLRLTEHIGWACSFDSASFGCMLQSYLCHLLYAGHMMDVVQPAKRKNSVALVHVCQ